MDEQHWGSNPGSSEASKRPLSASAHKESQKEHAQKPKGTAVMASTQPQVLFGGKSAGSVHAPPLEAALTTTSNEKGGPLRPPHHNGTAQQPALQAATVHPSASGWNPIFPLSSSLYDGTDSIGGIAFDICHISWPRVSTHASTSTPSTISRAERHVLIGPHLPKAFSCTPVHRNIAPSHARRTVHCTGACTTTHISSRGWSCRKTRANRFTITESSLVHLVARKARPQFETQCSAASKRCCSPLASLRCYNLVVAVAVCSAPARSCCILPSSCCLQHPLLVLIAHNTLYNC